MAIISFQSRVVWGSVGNAIAVPALQALGHDVWSLDTVVFSNHPGRGPFTGRVTPAGELSALLDGLEQQGAFEHCDAVISGYLGSGPTAGVVADAVSRVRRIRPDALYLCDPVMGSPERGLYVDPAIPPAVARDLVPLADVVTPNRFELATLTTTPVAAAEDVAAARTQASLLAGCLAQQRLGLVVVKSVAGVPGRIGVLGLVADSGRLLTTERIRDQFNGSGDLLAAILGAALVSGEPALEALPHALGLLLSVLKQKGDRPEIPLHRIPAAFARPHRTIETEVI